MGSASPRRSTAVPERGLRLWVLSLVRAIVMAQTRGRVDVSSALRRRPLPPIALPAPAAAGRPEPFYRGNAAGRLPAQASGALRSLVVWDKPASRHLAAARSTGDSGQHGQYASVTAALDDRVSTSDDAVAIGARRLAVIDLRHTGRQPIANEDGSVHAVPNAERSDRLRRSYGTRLERRGHHFRTRSDAEVSSCTPTRRRARIGVRERLDGMFALALWDRFPRRCLPRARARSDGREAPSTTTPARRASPRPERPRALCGTPTLPHLWTPKRLTATRRLDWRAVPALDPGRAGGESPAGVIALVCRRADKASQLQPYWKMRCRAPQPAVSEDDWRARVPGALEMRRPRPASGERREPRRGSRERGHRLRHDHRAASPRARVPAPLQAFCVGFLRNRPDDELAVRAASRRTLA